MKRLVGFFATAALIVAGLVGSAANPAAASVPDWDIATHHQIPATPGHAAMSADGAQAKLTGSGYYYAGAFESGISVTGISGKMRVSNPYVACNPGEHSIMELALQDHPGGSPDNATEIGWQKSCGDTGPKLFVTNWTGGVFHGCYSASGCSGWRHNASNPLDIGSYITSDSALCVGTSQACIKTFKIEYRASTCGSTSTGTFFTYDGTDLGCFDSTQLPSTSYTQSQEYGEVYFAGSTVPCTDMGNGKYSNAGPYSSLSPAVIQSVTYVPASPAPSLTFNTATDANAYTITGNGSTGNRTFSVGGPGYTSTGTSPGNVGSC